MPISTPRDPEQVFTVFVLAQRLRQCLEPVAVYESFAERNLLNAPGNLYNALSIQSIQKDFRVLRTSRKRSWPPEQDILIFLAKLLRAKC